MLRAAALLILLAAPALAYEGAGMKREADGGTIQPVLTKPPALTKFVEAVYPPAALDAGSAGDVALKVDLDAKGHVTKATVTRSAGPDFDDAAQAAVLQFEFSPAEIDGQPAPVQLEYVYHFELKVLPPPAAPPDAGPPPPPVNFKGRVLERVSREVVVAATVSIPKYDLHAETDADGRFELAGVPPGEQDLEVVSARHRKFETTEEFKKGEVTELTLWLIKKPGAFETTIIGEREKKEVSRRVLQKEELQTVPGTFGDPLRVLQNLPGMARPPLISGALLVRGAQPEDSQVLIDGVPIPLLYHFGGGPSVLAPSYIDQIDFFPGAYGARYGRAIGGVIDVTTGGAEPKAVHGTGGIDLINGGLYLEGPIGANSRFGSLSLAGRHSLIDLILPALLRGATPPGQASFVVSPAYWDYQGRYRLSLGQHKLELSAYGSNDQLTLATAGDTDVQAFSLNTMQGFHRFRLKWSLATEDGWSLAFAPSFGFTLNSFNISDALKFAQNSTDLTIRGSAKKDVFDGLSVETGVDINARFFDNSFETPGTVTDEDPNPAPHVTRQRVNVSSYAVYAEALFAASSRFKVVPGIRVDVYALPRKTEPSFEPRIGLRFKVTDWLSLKAASGLYRQSPTSNELDPLFGNPYLGLSMSHQTAGGLELRPLPQALPHLSLDVQGFYNARSQLVVSSSALVERSGEMAFERLKNGGVGRAYGLEVLLKHDLTERFFGWIAYTFSRSEQLDEDTGTYVPVSFDQAHILTVVASYKFDFGLEVGLRFRVTTGRPETPVLGSTFDADSGAYSAVRGAPGSVRGSTFNQLDLRVEKQWVWSYWKLSAYLDVQNVYNAPNPEQTLWDYRYKESAPLNGLPFLPTFGLKGEF